ncbi:membrane protein [Neisseria meningitidis]|nr:membrane protein [Neisseria meningitidis]CWT02821.1 membrane protein [Neisseria meningitidis]
MILLHLDFLSALLYAAVFLFLIFRAGMLQWFWASIMLWLGISVLGAKLMPGIWGMTRAAPLFIPHFYLTLGSIFFSSGIGTGKRMETDGRQTPNILCSGCLPSVMYR